MMAGESRRVVGFRRFGGTFSSWDSLMTQAADFASRLPAGDLIGISHSAMQLEGMVVVWYWHDASPAAESDAPAPALDY